MVLKLSQRLGNVYMTLVNPFMPTGAFNICCPRDCVSRHNGGTSGAPLKPLKVDSALRALSSLWDLRGAPAVPQLCRDTQSLGKQMLNATVGINGLILYVQHLCNIYDISTNLCTTFIQHV